MVDYVPCKPVHKGCFPHPGITDNQHVRFAAAAQHLHDHAVLPVTVDGRVKPVCRGGGMQQSMAAFGGIAPTYHIALLDKPTIIWDFHSLMLGVQMMFSFMLTDSENPIKLCRHCTKAFVASRPSAVFCSPQCKNKHNVYKSRARNKSEE